MTIVLMMTAACFYPRAMLGGIFLALKVGQSETAKIPPSRVNEDKEGCGRDLVSV